MSNAVRATPLDSAASAPPARPAPGELRRRRLAAQRSAPTTASGDPASPASPPRALSVPRAHLASMTQRLIGGAIDTALILIVSGVVTAFLTRSTPATTQIRINGETGARTVISAASEAHWLIDAFPVLLTAVYAIVLIALWGRTVGGWCVGIVCIPADAPAATHRRRPGFLIAAKRWLVLYGAAGLLSFLPYIGTFAWLLTLAVALSPLLDQTDNRQGLQDRFAGDLVVRRSVDS